MVIKSFSILAVMSLSLGLACAADDAARQAANNAAAVATLKSALFPACITFQAGCYNDEDGDNLGEYGTIAQMAGQAVCNGSWFEGKQMGTPLNTDPQASLKLVDAKILKVSNGYRFVMYMPCASEGFSTAAKAGSALAIGGREKYFLIYAYPEQKGVKGAKLFVMAQDGKVRVEADTSVVGQYGGDSVPPWWLAMGKEKPAEKGRGLYIKTRVLEWPEYHR